MTSMNGCKVFRCRLDGHSFQPPKLYFKWPFELAAIEDILEGLVFSEDFEFILGVLLNSICLGSANIILF